MEQPESRYQSYLLRLWRSDEGEASRVILEHVSTHERYGFADLEGLCAFLQKQMSGEVQALNTYAGENEKEIANAP